MHPEIRKGAEGAAVVLLQERLLAKGFVPGAVDGDFGPKTERAVRQFQAANGLKVDGVVGDRTWAVLMVGQPVQTPEHVIDATRAEMVELVEAQELEDPRIEGVLMAAIETIGWREEPDGSNDGPEVGLISRGYYAVDYEAEHGKPPWCALAISYWLRVGLGVETYADIPFGARLGAVSQLENWGKARGSFQRSLVAMTAPTGAIFTMSRSGSGSDPSTAVTSGHTGFVLADEGRQVLTIEGNAGNAVIVRRRRKSELRGWLTWW